MADGGMLVTLPPSKSYFDRANRSWVTEQPLKKGPSAVDRSFKNFLFRRCKISAERNIQKTPSHRDHLGWPAVGLRSLLTLSIEINTTPPVTLVGLHPTLTCLTKIKIKTAQATSRKKDPLAVTRLLVHLKSVWLVFVLLLIFLIEVNTQTRRATLSHFKPFLT